MISPYHRNWRKRPISGRGGPSSPGVDPHKVRSRKEKREIKRHRRRISQNERLLKKLMDSGFTEAEAREALRLVSRSGVRIEEAQEAIMQGLFRKKENKNNE